MFRLSRCVGLRVAKPERARKFYERAFGMTYLGDSDGLELAAGPLRLFLDPGPPGDPVFELLTEDLVSARVRLRGFGLEEASWRGSGQLNLVADPFGMRFNVYEDPAAFLPPDLEPPVEGFLRPCLGMFTAVPEEAAGFYGQILESSPSPLADGAWIVDSGPLRLRFSPWETAVPCLWLTPDAPLDRLESLGCVRESDGWLRDPNGLAWAIGEPLDVTHAAVEI